MIHFSHEHLLVLKKAEEFKTIAVAKNLHHKRNDAITCHVCLEPISGPFYSCQEEYCDYYLHKICAELPKTMKHPMHPEHPLTLLADSPYKYGIFVCNMCRMSYENKNFVYNCSICYFNLDIICAIASHTIEDKCHVHPLTHVQSSFRCHICRKKEEGASYKCRVCAFWVHQNCTLLSATVKCCDHDHELTLLPSIPNQFRKFFADSVCEICEDTMTSYETVYSCVGCSFFSHARCAVPSSLKHFSHEHLLVLNKAEEIKIAASGSYRCHGCDEPILGHFYSCKEECGYYLHKVCAELPIKMSHPMHPQHPLTLLAKSLHDDGNDSFKCTICKRDREGFVYSCSICSFDLDMICAIASHTIKDKSHTHPLIPIQLPSSFFCNICRTEEKSDSYKCGTCPFWVHQNCTLLPDIVKCSDHDHQLNLLHSIPIEFHEKQESTIVCGICHDEMTAYETVYSCVECKFFAHASCTTSSNIKPSSLEIEMNHFGHEHLLVLKKYEEFKTITVAKNLHHKRNDAITCHVCHEPISGPFYSCQKEYCDYYLHKICAELPKTMNHPMHPQHPLTLLAESLCNRITYKSDRVICDLCNRNREGFVYNCSICSFNIDMICAIASHKIEDKCHMHPLTPVQSSFRCNICSKKEEGDSYKCGVCLFRVHQNCTLLPDTVKCSEHDHELTLSPSIPNQFRKKFGSNVCEICEDTMTAYETVYSCVGCKFFAHASCAISSWDLKTKHLPMRKDWTSLISLIFNEKNICEECGRLVSYCKCRSKLPEQISNSNRILDYEINHFSHDHVLHLLDGQVNDKVCGKVCEACAEPISDPSYGCTQCDYFLHKCCVDLPEQMNKKISSIPSHPKHDMKLFAQYPSSLHMFQCYCCSQWCNTFGYRCDRCEICIDVKCASLSGRIKHEAHKHTLFSFIKSSRKCSACGYILPSAHECKTCNFGLCHFCTMLPAVVNHRYCKCQGFKLQYSPVKDYHTDYYCDLCEQTLQPKSWFYHCGECDQFAHPNCLIKDAGDSNIKFGKLYNLPEHEHVLILTRFTHEYSSCKICGTSLNKGFAVGFECASCPYLKIHLQCVEPWKDLELIMKRIGY